MSTDTASDAGTRLREQSRADRMELLFDFNPFEYQREPIQHAEETTVTQVALKPGRQVGKSVTGGNIAAERALAGHDVMILAPYEDTTEDMMQPARDAFETARQKAAEFAEFGSLGVEVDNKRDWQFAHGGRLRARTVGTDGKQVRGKNPDVVLVDEAAYIPDRIYEQVIEPYFLSHNSYEYYLFSTPAGKSGYFYHAVEGRNAESWWTREWPSTINPLNDEEWIAQKQEERDSRTFAQEYLGEFVDEGDAFLPADIVRPCRGNSTLSGEVWLGVDVARKGNDRTVMVAVDADGNAEVLHSEQESRIPGIVGHIKRLHREHQFREVLVDENAVGGGVVDDPELTEMDIMRGVSFTTKSKHEMYNRLKSDLESESLTLPHHRRLESELTQLQYDVTANGYYKVSHPSGGHDDFADALALANWGASGAGGGRVVRTNARAAMNKRR